MFKGQLTILVITMVNAIVKPISSMKNVTHVLLILYTIFLCALIIIMVSLDNYWSELLRALCSELGNTAQVKVLKLGLLFYPQVGFQVLISCCGYWNFFGLIKLGSGQARVKLRSSFFRPLFINGKASGFRFSFLEKKKPLVRPCFWSH